ncbi:MAG: DUF4230 domain-containing protein [Spirochaetales bacterium]|nr:DUF4230 domain-containing protein [Spirochaetales bacterium]
MKFLKTILLIICILQFSCKKSPLLPENLDLEIKNITNLSTYQHIYRDIIYIRESKHVIGIPIYDKSVLFTINIHVIAGIDFENLEYKISEETITITLPESKIFSIDADESSIFQYFIKEKNSKIDILTIYNAINEKKLEIHEDAISRGILKKAEDNAKVLISDFLFSTGFKEVFFEKKDTKDSE